MGHEELFLHTMDSLRQVIKDDTKFGYIKASGLLRHLLLDTPTLFTQANRDIRMKVLFEVKDRTKKKATKFVPVDALRKELVLNYNFHLYTVHDIIDIVSHKLGGIHSSEPTTKEESILMIINELKPDMFMGQKIRPPVIAAIRKIILTVLNDLKPLEDAVKARTFTGGL